jgi:type VI protein secretion system component VasA
MVDLIGTNGTNVKKCQKNEAQLHIFFLLRVTNWILKKQDKLCLLCCPVFNTVLSKINQYTQMLYVKNNLKYAF